MNQIQPILPIQGVPDELLRVLNDRFRDLAQAQDAAAGSTTTAAGTAATAAPSATPATFGDITPISAPSISTSTITDIADLTYSLNEVTMLGNLKVALNQLNVDVASLATAVNAIRARLTSHGITR